MIAEKEAQLKQYYELTNKILDALVCGREDVVPGLLEQRGTCISVIDKLNEEAGTLLMNQHIQLQLLELESIEQEIREHLQQFMRKLANRVRFVKNEQYLTKQYEESMYISKGVFYDRTK